MLTDYQPSPEEESSEPIESPMSGLYDSKAYHKKLIDRLRTFYVYAQSGKLTLTRRHGQGQTALYFSDGTLIQIESTEPGVETSPGNIEKTLLHILGWKDAQLNWTPDVYPEERPLAYEINLLFKEIDRIHQSKRTQNWGRETCNLIVAPSNGGGQLPLLMKVKLEQGGFLQYTLVTERTILGRDPHQVDIAIPAASLSRKHALLQVIESGIFIQDLGSSNGTFINDEPLKPNLFYPLGDSDRLRIAGHQITLEPATEVVTEAIRVKAESQLRRLKRHMQHWDPAEALSEESAPPPGFGDTEPVPKT